MRDIARLANVSMPTVSRVLNDSPLVTGETRARVLEVAQANGYAVNRNAKKLRQARTGTIDQKIFHEKLDTDLKQYEVLPGFFHGILFDIGKEKVYDKIVDFVEKCFNRNIKQASLSPDPFSVKEYKNLQNNVGNTLNFKMQKLSLGKIGKISNGMAIGLKYGFD